MRVGWSRQVDGVFGESLQDVHRRGALLLREFGPDHLEHARGGIEVRPNPAAVSLNLRFGDPETRSDVRDGDGGVRAGHGLERVGAMSRGDVADQGATREDHAPDAAAACTPA